MSNDISPKRSREEDDLGNHFEKKPKRDQGERISRPPERKSLDLIKQEATRAEGKKHEARQKERIDTYVKKVIEKFNNHGGIFNNMSVQGVGEFMAKGAEYGGWLRLMSREDIQDLKKMVQQDKLSLSHFCPADIKALREMEEAARVEAGQGRGKDHFEPWIGHRACNEYGKPVARTVHLATESTPEKPILPGKGYNGPFDNTFRDSLSLSDAKIRKLRAGKDISTVLSPYEYQKYQEKYGQSSASSERQESSSKSEDNRSARSSSREVIEAESEAESEDNRSARSSSRDVSEAESEGEASEAESEDNRSTRSSDSEVSETESEASSDTESERDEGCNRSELIPLPPYWLFTNRYAYSPSVELYPDFGTGACVVNATMMVFRAHGLEPDIEDVKEGLGYPVSSYGGVAGIEQVEDVLKDLSNSKVIYSYSSGYMDIDEIKATCKKGPIIAGIKFTHNSGHVVIVDGFETHNGEQFVGIIDLQSDIPSYMIPLWEWERANVLDYVIPD